MELGTPTAESLSNGVLRLSFPKLTDLEAEPGLGLAPFQVKLDAGDPHGYRRDWAPPGSLVERNIAYAVQWFALALAAAVGGVDLARGRPGLEPDDG
jgi:cytochrome oxidase assembly protein ShyY1